MQKLDFAACVSDVAAFHEKFGIDVNPLDDKAQYKLRVDRQQEEIKELADAKTLEDGADAIIDIIYIAAGTVQLLGERYLEAEKIGVDPHVSRSRLLDLFYRATHLGRNLPLQDLWNEVHSANMRKERGTEGTSKYGNKYDIVKPEGWVPPNIAKVLLAHGFNPEANPKTILHA